MTETVLDPATTPEVPASTEPEAAATPEATAPEAEAPGTSPEGGDTPTGDDKPKPDATATTESDLSDLTELTKEQRVQYADQLKKMSPEDRKVFNTLLTQKSQQAAAAAKAAEATTAQAKESAARLEKAQAFLDRLEKDPDAVLSEVQETIQKRKKPEPEKPATIQVDPAFLAEIESHLPDGSKPLAPLLAPVLKGLLEKELQPLRTHVESEQTKAAAAAGEKVMTEFAAAHPDYKEHEAAMLVIGKKLSPSNMSQGEFLETLYTLATKDVRAKTSADAVVAAEKKRAEEVIAKAAKAASNADPETGTVSSTRVKYTKQAPNSFQEAFEMAKRGEEVES